MHQSFYQVYRMSEFMSPVSSKPWNSTYKNIPFCHVLTLSSRMISVYIDTAICNTRSSVFFHVSLLWLATNSCVLFPCTAFNDWCFKEIRLFLITAPNQMHKRISQIVTLKIPVCFSPQGTIITEWNQSNTA